MKYLGYLPRNDPLYGYLRYDIFPQLVSDIDAEEFKVYSVSASNHVYLYQDAKTEERIIGKFFGDVPGRSAKSAQRRMEREHNNILQLRSLGFTGYPHYVVRPLGHNVHLNCLLVEEFCYGRSLNDFIVDAIQNGNGNGLFQKLTALAYFLATMHNRAATLSEVDFNKDCSYFDRILHQLQKNRHLKLEDFDELCTLRDRWRKKECMWEDKQVLVHGDVTPTNILFGNGLWVIAVDLERMKRADRVFDVGRVAGELKHFFMLYTGNETLAEPYIGHFLWEYACHFPERESAFDSIVRRVPFHMGLNLLRIARNPWIDPKYRSQLIKKAKKTLM